MRKLFLILLATFFVSCSSDSENNSNNFNLSFDKAYFENGDDWGNSIRVSLLTSGLDVSLEGDIGFFAGDGAWLTFDISTEEELTIETGVYAYNESSNLVLEWFDLYNNLHDSEIGTSDYYIPVNDTDNSRIEILNYSGGQIEIYYSLNLYDVHSLEFVDTIEGTYSGSIEELTLFH
ncbi:hypothetical protein GCM10023314_26500 [Algibacter agarivorans]|uniref:Uncharacterized protein n=1 Tax=Algibacter agarivorans TaxID=1109741 RepID=A0ABP9GSR7_9FLAO